MVTYSGEKLDIYKKMLKNTGALSRLFSENDAPYLVPRSAENIYCIAFDAKNLGRADCSADAKYGDVGVGIKTFLHNKGNTLQKVAEFNKDAAEYRGKTPKEIVKKIAELRNKRIEFTKRTYGIKEMIYHCITRLPSIIATYEEPMDTIEIDKIKNIRSTGNTIFFEDRKNEYSFSLTKSTLFKRFNFVNKDPLFSLNVEILESPYIYLERIFKMEADKSKYNLSLDIDFITKNTKSNIEENLEFVILPLFSDRGTRHVPEKSGINQWNAGGRVRNENELYIPIPSWIHRVFNEFFPPRDQPFDLVLPKGNKISAKVCQDGSKALMSNPNSDLGKWLLRDVMNLDAMKKEILTYDKLLELNIDSIIITKKSARLFEVDFREIGSYDDFKNEFNEEI